MSAEERDSNAPGGSGSGDEDGAGKAGREADRTLPDGGPNLPKKVGVGAVGSEDDKAAAKSAAAKKLAALAAEADAARSKSAKAPAAAQEPEGKPEEKPEDESKDAGESVKSEDAKDAAVAKASADAKAAADEMGFGDLSFGDDSSSEPPADAKDEPETAAEEPAQKALYKPDSKPPGDSGSSADVDFDIDDEEEFEAPTAIIDLEQATRLREEAGATEGDGDDDSEEDEEDEEGEDAGDGGPASKDGDDGSGEDDLADAGLRVHYYGQTNVGLIRDHNEDNFTVIDVTHDVRGTESTTPRRAAVGPEGLVFAVCDGMGGAAAGEVASQMAVDTVYAYFKALGVAKSRDHFAQRVITAVEEAGNRIFSAAKMDRSRRGMGTTATVAGLIDQVLFVGQVGDSRAYVLRDGELGLITKDQSLVNQLIEAGQLNEEEAEAFEHSNIILQALGTTEEVTVDLTFLELRKGDRLMLCSDGLSGLVHPEMLKEVLATTPDLPECADKLIEMANAGGGHDNITVVIADFDGDDLSESVSGQKAVYAQYPLPPGLEEERESLMPREPQMKSGAKKPGADVKSRTDDTPTSGHRELRPAAPEEGASWGMIIGVLVVIAVIVAVFVMAEGGDGGHDSDHDGEIHGEIVPTGLGGAATDFEQLVPDSVADVEVRITTDIDGELYIDGDLHDEIAEGDELLLMLPPGAYQFEAMSGDDVVAEAMVTVSEGEPVRIALNLPAGATDVPQDPDAVPDDGDGDGDAPVDPGAAVPEGAQDDGQDAVRPAPVVAPVGTRPATDPETDPEATGPAAGSTTAMTVRPSRPTMTEASAGGATMSAGEGTTAPSMNTAGSVPSNPF